MIVQLSTRTERKVRLSSWVLSLTLGAASLSAVSMVPPSAGLAPALGSGAEDADSMIDSVRVAPPLEQLNLLPGLVQPVPEPLLLPKGTLIPMELLQDVSTSNTKAGDFFELRVVEPLLVNHQVAIPAKALATGEVIDSQKGGFGGKPGKLLITIRSVDVSGQKIALRLSHSSNGEDKTSSSLGLSLALGPLGLLVHGGDIAIPKGTVLAAKVAKDTMVQPTAFVSPFPPVNQPPQGVTP